MKKIAGPIRVELAQYRELASFAQFGSDLDKDTRDRLSQGERIMEVLKQAQYEPMSVADQSLILFAVTRKYLMEFEVEQVKLYEKKFIEFIDTKYSELREEIKGKDGLTSELEAKLKAVCDEFRDEFKRILEEE